jgi:hypothetical protein
VNLLRTGASRGALACDVTPSNHSFESTTICAVIGIRTISLGLIASRYSGVPPGRRPHMVSDPAINRRATVVCPSGTPFGRCRGHDPRVFPSFSRKKDLLTTEEVMKLSKLHGPKGHDNLAQPRVYPGLAKKTCLALKGLQRGGNATPVRTNGSRRAFAGMAFTARVFATRASVRRSCSAVRTIHNCG